MRLANLQQIEEENPAVALVQVNDVLQESRIGRWERLA
jgi:hypothetical protein